MGLKDLMGSVRKMISLQEFEQSIARLEEITSTAALEKFQSAVSEIIFIGRPTCPYCRKMLPKLLEVMVQDDLNVRYLNSSNSSDKDLINFRNTVGVATVPSIVRVGGKNKFKNLGLESSATVEDIREAIINS